MAELVEIDVTLSSEWHLTAPSVEFWIDDNLISDDFVSEKNKEKASKKLSWKGDLDDGDHVIKIKLKNKTNKETVINKSTNEILFDQLLHIETISIDEIDLGFLCYKLGKFYPDKTLRPDLDDVIPTLNCIGYNGEWQLKFQVPTYLWLLENF